MVAYLPPNVPMFSGFEIEPDEWHGEISITLDELIDCGVVDFDAENMQWNAPDEETRKRINDKIVARYGIREISITPPGVWMRQFVRKMNELVPKYNLIWERIKDEEFDAWQKSRDYGKSRHIYSDFPQTMLGGNEDYATAGNDKEHEDGHEGDILARAREIGRNYQDVDVMLLDELEVMFSGLISSNFNGF